MEEDRTMKDNSAGAGHTSRPCRLIKGVDDHISALILLPSPSSLVLFLSRLRKPSTAAST